jgi:protein-S-isoprenylcysteine O-methyltransferase Ste14
LSLVVVKILMIAGIAVLPLPALFLGARGIPGRRRFAAEQGDRLSQLLLVGLRLFVLLLILGLSGLTLLSLIGALVKAVAMPGLVYVFFFLDLLLAALVVLTFGRSVRPPARRPASPAAR